MESALLRVLSRTHLSTEPEVFLDKRVPWDAPDREGKHARRRNKKVRDFTDPFIHKSTLHSIKGCAKFSQLTGAQPFKDKCALLKTWRRLHSMTWSRGKSQSAHKLDDSTELCRKKGMLCLALAWRGRLWLAAAGQKLSLNLAPFLLLNPVCTANPARFTQPYR